MAVFFFFRFCNRFWEGQYVCVVQQRFPAFLVTSFFFCLFSFPSFSIYHHHHLCDLCLGNSQPLTQGSCSKRISITSKHLSRESLLNG